MHREDLMRPDLLSEIILLTFGVLVLVSVAVFAVFVLTNS